MISQTTLAIRLPKSLKHRVAEEAKARMLSGADIAREALLDYFARRDGKSVVQTISHDKEVAA
jgi:predicted transcriptional regulator